MKKVLALTAGVLVALAPTGTAFAEQADLTVPGKAYGNCGHSSKGGEPHTGILAPELYNKGNGGLVQLAKDPDLRKVGCEAVSTAVSEPTPPPAVYTDAGR